MKHLIIASILVASTAAFAEERFYQLDDGVRFVSKPATQKDISRMLTAAKVEGATRFRKASTAKYTVENPHVVTFYQNNTNKIHFLCGGRVNAQNKFGDYVGNVNITVTVGNGAVQDVTFGDEEMCDKAENLLNRKYGESK